MSESIKYDKHFKPLAVAELLTGDYHFQIPSFQRGYRWERKQVKDLLDDIFSFSNGDQASYFLQPIVVKEKKDEHQSIADKEKEDVHWVVLDGQQRLTTMLLLLMRSIASLGEDEREEFSDSLYDISYSNRPDLDFKSPDPKKTIDGFYLSEAKGVIDRWFKEKKEGHINLNDFRASLLYKNAKKQVKFIWYAIPSDSEELVSINIFNRLNKGKIGLTSSELIKALFVLDKEEETPDDSTAAAQIVMEWNEMERKFQDDRFWYFISNESRNIQTRIDILFDFLTGKPAEADSDYSYRLFQNLFDYTHMDESAHVTDDKQFALDPLWVRLEISSMREAWKEIKRTFDRLVSWYDDSMYFHYVGFLVSQGSSPMEVHKKLETEKANRHSSDKNYEWTREDTRAALRRMITDRFKFQGKAMTIADIDKFEYGYGTNDRIRRLLLLFNVELCIHSGNQRFKFDKYKTEKWDIEHIDSQNDSCLQEPEDRIQWLKNATFILKIENPSSDTGKQLLSDCKDMIEEFDRQVKGERKFPNDKYFPIYTRINKYFSFDANSGDTSYDEVDLSAKDKDSINNLTLLNSDINRSYKDAPFPYKRYVIIETDKAGSHFIPIGTRNLFLKYYTSTDSSVSQLQAMRWNEEDKKNYLAYMHKIVDPYFE